MLRPATIPSKTLATICRRLSISLAAGVDIRRAFKAEVGHASRRWRASLETIAADLANGTALEDALVQIHGVFPELFREMVVVGEQTGSLPEVLRRLAAHYEHQTQIKRQFLAGITWPMIQLAMAVFVVGLLIYLPTTIAGSQYGESLDLLGIGLVGARGLKIYAGIVLVAISLSAILLFALRRGTLWMQPVQVFAMRLPVIGRCLEQLALARITWTLELTLGVAMQLQRLLPLVFRATGNHFYSKHASRAATLVAGGDPIHVAMAKLGVFPSEFLASVEVGEESGSLAETMGHLSQDYEQQARSALATLVKVASFLIWCLVAAAIAMVLIRFVMMYAGMIEDLSKGKV